MRIRRKNRTTKSRKIITNYGKDTSKYFGIVKADTIKQATMKEKKAKKRVPLKNEKNTQNQTL